MKHQHDDVIGRREQHEENEHCNQRTDEEEIGLEILQGSMQPFRTTDTQM